MNNKQLDMVALSFLDQYEDSTHWTPEYKETLEQSVDLERQLRELMPEDVEPLYKEYTDAVDKFSASVGVMHFKLGFADGVKFAEQKTENIDFEVRMNELAEHYELMSRVSSIVVNLADSMYTKENAQEELMNLLLELKYRTPILPNQQRLA